MITSPPRPPSPPDGPPRGTNFSRRNAMQPFPPSPAFTRIFASSMNIVLASSRPSLDGEKESKQLSFQLINSLLVAGPPGSTFLLFEKYPRLSRFGIKSLVSSPGGLGASGKPWAAIADRPPTRRIPPGTAFESGRKRLGRGLGKSLLRKGVSR